MAARGSRKIPLAELLARFPLDEETGKRKEWLTTPEVMWVTNVHEITVYRWVGSGQLKAYHVRAMGKASLYKQEDVETLLRSRFTPSEVPTLKVVPPSGPSKPRVKVKARRTGGEGDQVGDGAGEAPSRSAASEGAGKPGGAGRAARAGR